MTKITACSLTKQGEARQGLLQAERWERIHHGQASPSSQHKTKCLLQDQMSPSCIDVERPQGSWVAQPDGTSKLQLGRPIDMTKKCSWRDVISLADMNCDCKLMRAMSHGRGSTKTTAATGFRGGTVLRETYSTVKLTKDITRGPESMGRFDGATCGEWTSSAALFIGLVFTCPVTWMRASFLAMPMKVCDLFPGSLAIDPIPTHFHLLNCRSTCR